MATKSSHVARVEGVDEGRSSVVVRYVVAEGGIGIKDTSEVRQRMSEEVKKCSEEVKKDSEGVKE